MQELHIIVILSLICIGQIFAILRGRLTAAIYYCCVAPLGYFSVWMFATWGPDRLCGMLLIAGGLLAFKPAISIPRFGQHRFAFFLAFLVLITTLGSLFWPIESMAGKSEVYGSLRGAVQIINWFIQGGAAWQIAIALSQPGAFEKARRVIIIVGVLHSGYAMYQYTATYTGLPATGIRRAYEGVGAESGGEQFAAFNLQGQIVQRPGSFVGEPKSLGAMSLVWIAAILSLFMERRKNTRLVWALILSLAALFLTFSTSAWIGFICMLIISIWTPQGQPRARFASWLTPAILLIVILAIVDDSGFLPDSVSVNAIIRTRTVEREYLADMPELEAKKVLAEKPYLVLTGTGLGGMSFYIAENLGGSDIILFPNTGLLAYICDMGLIGLALLAFSLRSGLRPTLIPSTRTDATTRSLSFIGTSCLVQSFIFDAGIILFALAFLLAAEFRGKQNENRN